MAKEILNHIISYEELFIAIENDNTENAFKIAGRLLLQSVTDWPTLNLKEPKDLLRELKAEVNNVLSYTNIHEYSKRLNPNQDAWKIEAVASLLEMFDYNNIIDTNIELENIIERLSKHYRK